MGTAQIPEALRLTARGSGVGTLKAYARMVYGLLGLKSIGNMQADSTSPPPFSNCPPKACRSDSYMDRCPPHKEFPLCEK